MREIKFRGIAQVDGREVTGDGAYVTDGFECVISRMVFIHCKAGTVAQLIGIDKYGAEIYEKDPVTDDNTIWGASFTDLGGIKDGVVYKTEF